MQMFNVPILCKQSIRLFCFSKKAVVRVDFPAYANMSYKIAKFDISRHFGKIVIFVCMTPLHSHAQYIPVWYMQRNRNVQ